MFLNKQTSNKESPLHPSRGAISPSGCCRAVAGCIYKVYIPDKKKRNKFVFLLLFLIISVLLTSNNIKLYNKSWF